MIHFLNEGNNSALRLTKFPLGKDIKKHLQDTLSKYEDKSGCSGFERLNNILSMNEKEGGINYNEMTQLKNVFDHIDKKSEEYQIIGGDLMNMWVDTILRGATERVKQDKYARKAAGQENTFIRSHEKTRLKANTKPKITKVQTKNASNAIATNSAVKLTEEKKGRTIVLDSAQVKAIKL